MPPRGTFKLRERAAIGAAIAAALPGAAHAATPAGQVNFAIGDVSRIDGRGASEPLRRGAIVNSGDTIRTARGRVQIRFNDGGFTSLKPNTEFRVDEFNFEGEANGRERGIFSLIRGGLRTITGVIGRRDRDAYQLRTRVATIGIRGTGYGADDDGDAVDMRVLDGYVEMCNAGGCVIGAPGAVARFVSDTQTGTLENDPENSNTSSDAEDVNKAQQQAITEGKDDIDEGERSEVVPPAEEPETPVDDKPILPSGPGYALAIAFHDGDVVEGFTFSKFGTAAGDPADATFVGTSSTAALVAYEGPAGNVGSGALGSSVVVEYGADAVIGWGRWTAGVTTGSGVHPLDLTSGASSMHYVIGKPTETMPSMGEVTYNLLGATTPTLASGEGDISQNQVNSASLTADFQIASATLDLDVTVQVNGAMRGYTVDGLGMNITQVGGVNTHAFAGNSPSGASSTPSDGTCSGGCAVSAEGFFAGVNAARAGVAYKIETGVQSQAGPDDKILGVLSFTAGAGGQ